MTIPLLFGLLHSRPLWAAILRRDFPFPDGPLGKGFLSPAAYILERWASGLNRRSRKPLNDSVVPGVRISFSPQTTETQRFALGFRTSAPCKLACERGWSAKIGSRRLLGFSSFARAPAANGLEKRHTRQRVANLLRARHSPPRRAEGEKAREAWLISSAQAISQSHPSRAAAPPHGLPSAYRPCWRFTIAIPRPRSLSPVEMTPPSKLRPFG